MCVCEGVGDGIKIYQPSGHIGFIQRRMNVEATSIRFSTSHLGRYNVLTFILSRINVDRTSM